MKKLSKVFATIITSAFILGLIPITSFAEGSLWIGESYIQLKVGETYTINVGADNAAGKVEWYSEGDAASANGNAWLENNSEGISIYASEPGTAYIHVNPTDIATFDGDEITSGYTITVEVVGTNTAADDIDDNNADNEQPADDNNDSETPAEDQETTEVETETTEAETETTTVAETETASENGMVEIYKGADDYSELESYERRTVYINDVPYVIIQYPLMKAEDSDDIIVNPEINGIQQLKGFELNTVLYKGIDVDSFVYNNGELTVFVLENQTNYKSDYFTYDAETNTFNVLPYLNVNQKIYVMINIPDSFEIPGGYKAVDMKIGDSVIRGLQKVNEVQEDIQKSTDEELAADGDATTGNIVVDSREIVTLKGYRTEVSPGLESVDPTNDIYYIYCIVDGQKQLYSYDLLEGTIQRAAIIAYTPVESEVVTNPVADAPVEAPAETTPAAVQDAATAIDGIEATLTWKGISLPLKTLLIVLGVAILLVIFLIIVCLVLGHSNSKKERELEKKDAMLAAKRHSRKRSNGKSKNRPKKEVKEYTDGDDFFSYTNNDNQATGGQSSYEPLMRKPEKKSNNNDDIDIDFL